MFGQDRQERRAGARVPRRGRGGFRGGVAGLEAGRAPLQRGQQLTKLALYFVNG